MQDLADGGVRIEIENGAEVPDHGANLVGQTLLHYHGKSQAGVITNRLASALGVSRSVADKMLHAHACASAKCQENLFESLVKTVWRLKEASEVDPLLLIFHTQYDETPLRLRITWRGHKAGKEDGKVYVVQNSFSMVLKLRTPISDVDRPGSTSQYLVLRGQFSTAMQPTDRCHGEAVAGVLHSTCRLPERVAETFQGLVRAIETDEAGANTRGERLFGWPNWTRLHLFCSGHKLHAAAEKTFSVVNREMTSGVTRAVLSIQQSAHMNLAGF